MQTLEFVNVTSGSEPWKNSDAKKFVRSHAMKDFRRRQREGTGKSKKKGTQPGEGSFSVVTKKAAVRAKAMIKPPATMTAAIVPLRQNSPVSTGSPTHPLPNLRIDPESPLNYFSPNSSNESYLFAQVPYESAVFSLPSPSPSASSSSSRHSPQPIQESVKHPLAADFDLNVSTAVYAVLDGINGQFEKIIGIYFRSTHSWLTIVRKQRFIKRVAASRIRADATVAILLLCMRLVAEPFNRTKTKDDASRDTIYLAAKNLHGIIQASKGPSLELIQAGLIIALFEHNSAIPDVAYQTLVNCANMSSFLGLGIAGHNFLRGKNVSAMEEERKRTYWGIVCLERVIMLHDEKHERPILMPEPCPHDVLPAVRDVFWENGDDEASVPGSDYVISALVPKDADSFCRQVQASRIMGIVQEVIRIPYENDPPVMRARVFEVDRLLQEALGKLLFDCDGGCTQYCGPISLCVAGSFLLHDYQLRSTLTSSDREGAEAAQRSKMAIAKMVVIMVDILRAFPLQHLPELSPSALYCPYLAALHSLQLDRINGVRAMPTLGGNDLELLVRTLKHFSKMWKCTGEYAKTIERAQARALPLPLLVV